MKKDYPFNIFFLHHITQKSFVLTQTQSKKHSGFTLLELMVTVAIIAILAAIALPSYSNYITKSQAKSAASDLVALSVAVERKYLKTLAYTPSPSYSSDETGWTALTQGYASGWQSSTDSFNYKVDVNVSSKTYTLTAKGKAGTRNAGCTLTLDQANNRDIPNGKNNSPCGGMSSW